MYVKVALSMLEIEENCSTVYAVCNIRLAVVLFNFLLGILIGDGYDVRLALGSSRLLLIYSILYLF